MFEKASLTVLNNYFETLTKRGNNIVYFYKINIYNENIKMFLVKYMKSITQNGVFIKDDILNPTQNDLAYYTSVLGNDDIVLEIFFINNHLKSWLKNQTDSQREIMANAMLKVLLMIKNNGKPDSVIKNTYIKYMCWLHKDFVDVIKNFGGENIPKILYTGKISKYELFFLYFLNCSGCDVLIVNYDEEIYEKADPKNMFALSYNQEIGNIFPDDFSFEILKKEIANGEKLYNLKNFNAPINPATNTWLTSSEELFQEFLKNDNERNVKNGFFNNAFVQINGVFNKSTYSNELFTFYSKNKEIHSKFIIIENCIDKPNNAEISKIEVKDHNNKYELLLNLAEHLNYKGNFNLEKALKKSFFETILIEDEKHNLTLSKLKNKAMYLICLFIRYRENLFFTSNMNVSTLIYLGVCSSENENLFFNFMSKLPVDILIFNPENKPSNFLKSKTLFVKNYTDTLIVDKFPTEISHVQVGTVAFHAERDLDDMMYNNSGITRDYQYKKANAITLKSTFEEISILWNEPLNIRPNFSITDDAVNMPVFFAKVSGVKEGTIKQYWSYIKSLLTEDGIFIKAPYYIIPNSVMLTREIDNTNKFIDFVEKGAEFLGIKKQTQQAQIEQKFISNGKLLINEIKNNPSLYNYTYLPQDKQDYILEKIQLLIDFEYIKDTKKHEAIILKTLLSLNNTLVRIIQKFDYAKKNPKFIYVNTKEKLISLEDAILMCFLNLIGFDIIFFVPTGYQIIEPYLNKNIINEYQIGSYKYDLVPPDLKWQPSLKEILFKRR